MHLSGELFKCAHHWNENVVILMKFSSLAALEVVILTTFSAASDENFSDESVIWYLFLELRSNEGNKQ